MPFVIKTISKLLTLQKFIDDYLQEKIIKDLIKVNLKGGMSLSSSVALWDGAIEHW